MRQQKALVAQPWVQVDLDLSSNSAGRKQRLDNQHLDRADIEATLLRGVNNGRVEPLNTKIRLIALAALLDSAPPRR